MKHSNFLRPLAIMLAFLAGERAVQAQVHDWQLREHIVHDVDDRGQDVWRDDRIPTMPDTSICFIYVGRKQSGPLWVRLQVRYAAYRPLNIVRIRFSKGERALEFTPIPELLHHGNNGMIQWEWYDAPPDVEEVKVIQAIIAEPGVKLTLIGRDHTVERELSENERIAMENMVQQARVLGRAE